MNSTEPFIPSRGESYNHGMTSRLSSLCVFCGSSPGARPDYAEAATAFGRLLADRGIRLVYGAGNVGLMGILADAALAAVGKVIGARSNCRSSAATGYFWAYSTF